jgi:hypothetical protein
MTKTLKKSRNPFDQDSPTIATWTNRVYQQPRLRQLPLKYLKNNYRINLINFNNKTTLMTPQRNPPATATKPTTSYDYPYTFTPFHKT